MKDYSATQVLMARGGAILVVLALFTGGFAASAMSGKIHADGAIALAAHVTALLGAFWIFGAAWLLPMLRYQERTQRILAWTLLVSNYGGWLITAVKAFFYVHGINGDGPAANLVVFGLLNVIVVFPALIASIAIAVGFRRVTA